MHSIALPHRPGGRVTVVIDLDRSTREIVKKDSVASIETEGLLGSQYLAISFGSVGQPGVRDGDLIQSKPPLEMSELLAKASNILDSSQQAIQNASQATAHLNSVSAKIDSGQGSVGALVNDRKLYNNLEESTHSLGETLVQAQAGVTGFRENMDALKHNFLLRGYFKKRGYLDSADLTDHEIDTLPAGVPAKTFTYSAKQLFAGHDSARLQNQKSLNESGEFLANNLFGFAVVAVSAGPEGDSSKELELTEARAMVIRDYLVEHFGFDDSKIKTLGLGKNVGKNSEQQADTIRMLIFPVGSEMPLEKQTPAGIASKAPVDTLVRAPKVEDTKP